MTNTNFENLLEHVCKADTLPEVIHGGILIFHTSTPLDPNNDSHINIDLYDYKNKQYLIICKNTTNPVRKEECLTFTELTDTKTETQEFLESPVLDISHKPINVTYREEKYVALALKTLEKKRTPKPTDTHIANRQPTFLEIIAINKNGNLRILNDEAWMFTFS